MINLVISPNLGINIFNLNNKEPVWYWTKILLASDFTFYQNNLPLCCLSKEQKAMDLPVFSSIFVRQNLIFLLNFWN